MVNYSAIASWNTLLAVATEPFKQLAKKEEEFVVKFLRKDFRVLEIGSGSGRLLKIVAPYVKEAIGIEYEYLQVKDAEKFLQNTNNVKVVFTHAQNMPYPDNHFDLTFCVFNTLGNQNNDKFRVLQEMKRVTKKEGKIILSVYAENATTYQLELYEKWRNIFKQQGFLVTIKNADNFTLMLNEGHQLLISERFSKEKLARLISDAGFRNFTIQNLTEFSYIVIAEKSEIINLK